MTTSSITNSGSAAPTPPVPTVASTSSAAAAGGSVIDVGALVSQLVAAAQAPQEALITQQTESASAQISSLGTLKSALSTFQASLAAIDTPQAFDTLTASSSSTSAFTATASPGAPAGAYTVTVAALAQAEQLLSKAFTGGTTVIGTGSLSISLGSASFDVTISGSNDTLVGVAAAIDAAAGNPGVQATVVQGTDGAHLLLSSALTGAANTIQVSETDGGSGLSAITYTSANQANYTQQAAAQDASYSIAGVAASSSSNTVADALPGVTLDLTGTTPTGSPATLTVSNDTSTVASNIRAFVSAYNTLAGTFSSLGGYDQSTSTAGPMMGDAALMGIENEIKSALYAIVETGSSAYDTLASVGITTNSDGTLTADPATLATALSTNFGAVSALFSSASGIAVSLDASITNALGPQGSLTAQSQSLTSQENALTARNNQLSQQMTQLSASLTEQYSALNSLLSSLQTTSAYLTQAFATLPQVQGSPRA